MVKTFSFGIMHISVAFLVVWAMTGDVDLEHIDSCRGLVKQRQGLLRWHGNVRGGGEVVGGPQR